MCVYARTHGKIHTHGQVLPSSIELLSRVYWICLMFRFLSILVSWIHPSCTAAPRPQRVQITTWSKFSIWRRICPAAPPVGLLCRSLLKYIHVSFSGLLWSFFYWSLLMYSNEHLCRGRVLFAAWCGCWSFSLSLVSMQALKLSCILADIYAWRDSFMCKKPN